MADDMIHFLPHFLYTYELPMIRSLGVSPRWATTQLNMVAYVMVVGGYNHNKYQLQRYTECS